MSVSAARAMFEQRGGEAPQTSAPISSSGGAAATAASGASVAVHTLSLDENTKRPRAVSCLAVNRDGTLFAYSPNNHEVHIAEYTGSGFNTISVLREHDQLVTSIDWAISTYNQHTDALRISNAGGHSQRSYCGILFVAACICLDWHGLQRQFRDQSLRGCQSLRG